VTRAALVQVIDRGTSQVLADAARREEQIKQEVRDMIDTRYLNGLAHQVLEAATLLVPEPDLDGQPEPVIAFDNLSRGPDPMHAIRHTRWSAGVLRAAARALDLAAGWAEYEIRQQVAAPPRGGKRRRAA
jgi:hypothetical protein